MKCRQITTSSCFLSTLASRDCSTSELTRIAAGISIPLGNDGVRLLQLGIMLLEIFCGQRMEDRKQEGNLTVAGNSDDVTNLGVLRRWIKAKKQEGNLSWATKDAVSHCIACFADPRTDLQDQSFRQSVIDNVVVPLLNELHHWEGVHDQKQLLLSYWLLLF